MKNFFYSVLRVLKIRSQRTLRLSLRFVALLLGLYGGYQVAIALVDENLDVARYFYCMVAFAAIVEFIFADVIAEASFPYDTERKLALMRNQVGAYTIDTIAAKLRVTISDLAACDTSLVSATVHVVTDLHATAGHRTRKGLLQLTDYVGPYGGRRGRITLVTQGVIGRCARTGKVESVNFADVAQYTESMIKDFGYTQEEADAHSTNGRSYLAVPIHHDKRIVGVLYFFSSAPQVFPCAAKNIDVARLTAEFEDHLHRAHFF